jgi:hypothetical protein
MPAVSDMIKHATGGITLETLMPGKEFHPADEKVFTSLCPPADYTSHVPNKIFLP